MKSLSRVELATDRQDSELAAGVPRLRQTFVVTHIQGMHARPCAALIRSVESFDCSITVQSGEHVANGRSILGLLSLAAGCHSKLTFTIGGPDAKAAMATVKRLFDVGFTEVYSH